MSKKGKGYDNYDFWADSQGSTSGSKPKRCFETHPGLKIGDYTIYGGSCSTPAVKDADIYIGFDFSMSFSTGHWPWAKKTEEIYYHITDMQAPADPASFKQMIAWIALQLKSGKKVHLGCIGGHGRTGTVLAALVTFMTGELDSINYVRKHYCTKAVEASCQVEFLHKHFGITKVDCSKGHGSFTLGQGYSGTKKALPSNVSPMSSSSAKSGAKAKTGQVITPVASRKDMWKDHAKL